MAASDEGSKQVETFLDRAIDHIRRIRIPRHAHVRMAAMIHDLAGVRWNLRSPAMHLHPNLDSQVRSGFAAGTQRPSDLFERFLLRYVLRETIWPHLNA